MGRERTLAAGPRANVSSAVPGGLPALPIRGNQRYGYQGSCMNIGCIAGLLVILAGPALADTTAVYEARNGAFKITIEIAANGDARSDVAAKPGSYVVMRNGEDFVVLTTPQGVVVDRMADLSQVTAKVAVEKTPELAKLGGELSHDLAAARLFVAGPVVSINGRSGTPYYFRMGYGKVDRPPVAVISTDPALAPIGRMMTRSFRMSEQMLSGMTGGQPNAFQVQLDEILNTGAPLAFAGAQLVSVDNAPIVPSRFELPGPPESPAAIEKRIRANATDHSVVGF
jgi:hypothetical protein